MGAWLGSVIGEQHLIFAQNESLQLQPRRLPDNFCLSSSLPLKPAPNNQFPQNTTGHPKTHHNTSKSSQLPAMDGLANLATTLTNRVSTNLRGSITDLTPEKFIRIVIVAGACMCRCQGSSHLLLRRHANNPIQTSFSGRT